MPLNSLVRASEFRRHMIGSKSAKSGNVVAHYARAVGIAMARMGPHRLRATARTNVLEHGAEIAKVQRWLGHANVATTRLYDTRQSRPKDSPTFRTVRLL